MAANKLQWRRIAKGDKLPCQSFLRKKNGEILKLSTGAGVTVGQDAYYLPVDDVIEEIRNYPIEETKDERVIEYFKELAPFYNAEELYDKYGFSHKDAIAWLEKKCEQKLYVNDNAKEMFIKALERVEEQNNKGYKLTDCDKNSWWEDFKAYTSCIIEQKPADKPKFHKGDWVVYCNDDVGLITGVEENGYCINNSGYIPFICASDVRLWTIEDAKDGDVLVSEPNCGLGTWYCIFKSLDDDESMTVYCYLSRDGRFETKKELCFDKATYNTKPATKEQRNTLLKAMADAGYTFDFEKKELKKIEQNPAWSEEDEKILSNIIKDLVHPWNEYIPDRIEDEIKWLKNKLKSLWPQNTWKPSDEQMDALHYVTNFDYGGHKATLVSLYEQLKKLKG